MRRFYHYGSGSTIWYDMIYDQYDKYKKKHQENAKPDFAKKTGFFLQNMLFTILTRVS